MNDPKPPSSEPRPLSSDPRSADTSSTATVALVGGPGSGKSYLFHAMAYRCHMRRWAGALAPFLAPFPRNRSVRVWRTTGSGAAQETTEDLLDAYRAWERLSTASSAAITSGAVTSAEGTSAAVSSAEGTERYRLTLTYSRGWLGRSTGRLDVELWNGLDADPRTGEALRRAGVLLFTLPMWAVFPSPTQVSTAELRRQRHGLEALETAIRHVKTLRKDIPPPKVMLLLTMADDARCGLAELQDAWIHRVIENERRHLEPLRRERRLGAYLQNARLVSDYLHRSFHASSKPVARILELLDISPERPWILPVSAVDGHKLEQVEQMRRQGLEAHPRKPWNEPWDEPVPAHVELPLLLALCEQTDALR